VATNLQVLQQGEQEAGLVMDLQISNIELGDEVAAVTRSVCAECGLSS